MSATGSGRVEACAFEINVIVTNLNTKMKRKTSPECSPACGTRIRVARHELVSKADLEAMPKLVDLARDSRILDGHLRSKLSSGQSLPPPFRVEVPVVIGTIKGTNVLVDGYRRLPYLADEVSVEQYDLDTLEEALLLRAQLNLESSRVITNLEAVTLALSLGIGTVPGQVHAERRSDAWNALGYEPHLTAIEFKVAPKISQMLAEEDSTVGMLVETPLSDIPESKPFSRLVKSELLGHRRREVFGFYHNYVRPINYFDRTLKRSLDDAYPHLIPVELDPDSVSKFGALLEATGDSSKWAECVVTYQRAWQDLGVKPPKLFTHVVESLRPGNYINGVTLNLFTELLNRHSDGDVYVAKVQASTCQIDVQTALRNAGWISSKQLVLEPNLLKRSKLVFFLNHDRGRQGKHWTVLVGEPNPGRFVHLDCLRKFGADPTAHIAHVRRVLSQYASVCGCATNVNTWIVPRAGNVPQQVASSNDCGLFVAIIAAALVFKTKLPDFITTDIAYVGPPIYQDRFLKSQAARFANMRTQLGLCMYVNCNDVIFHAAALNEADGNTKLETGNMVPVHNASDETDLRDERTEKNDGGWMQHTGDKSTMHKTIDGIDPCGKRKAEEAVCSTPRRSPPLQNTRCVKPSPFSTAERLPQMSSPSPQQQADAARVTGGTPNKSPVVPLAHETDPDRCKEPLDFGEARDREPGTYGRPGMAHIQSKHVVVPMADDIYTGDDFEFSETVQARIGNRGRGTGSKALTVHTEDKTKKKIDVKLDSVSSSTEHRPVRYGTVSSRHCAKSRRTAPTADFAGSSGCQPENNELSSFVEVVMASGHIDVLQRLQEGALAEIGCLIASTWSRQRPAISQLAQLISSEKRNELKASAKEHVSTFTDSACWTRITGEQLICQVLRSCLESNTYEDLYPKIRGNSQLYFRIIGGNMLCPWTLVAKSGIATGKLNYGLYYVGKHALPSEACVGYYGGRQLGLVDPSGEDNPDKLIRLRLKALTEVYIDGKNGVCGGMQYMNNAIFPNRSDCSDGNRFDCSRASTNNMTIDSSKNNMIMDEDGLCRAKSVIEPGDELLLQYTRGQTWRM